MNLLEERRLERGIDVVLGLFDRDDRLAVRAALARTVYGKRWAWVACRVNVDGRRVRALAGRGARLLAEARDRGRLERAALGAALAACQAGRKSEDLPIA